MKQLAREEELVAQVREVPWLSGPERGKVLQRDGGASISGGLRELVGVGAALGLVQRRERAEELDVRGEALGEWLHGVLRSSERLVRAGLRRHRGKTKEGKEEARCRPSATVRRCTSCESERENGEGRRERTRFARLTGGRSCAILRRASRRASRSS